MPKTTQITENIQDGISKVKEGFDKKVKAKIITEHRNMPWEFRNSIHNIIDWAAFFLRIEKYSDNLHYAAINIFNVAERNKNIGRSMIGGAIMALFFSAPVERFFGIAGTVITEVFSIAGAIVTIAGEALGSIYGLPILGLMGALGTYAVAAKLVNGCVSDPLLDKKYDEYLKNEIPLVKEFNGVINEIKNTVGTEQTSFVERLKEERASAIKENCVIS